MTDLRIASPLEMDTMAASVLLASAAAVLCITTVSGESAMMTSTESTTGLPPAGYAEGVAAKFPLNQVVALRRPSTVTTTTNTTARTGDVVFLPCETPQSMGKQVSWVRRQDWHILTSGLQTYTKEERFSVHHPNDSNRWTLVIKYVRPSDAGTYECQIVGGMTSMSQLVHLSVVTPRAVIPGNGEYHVDAGSTISLSCYIEESEVPPQFIFWYHNSRMINYDTQRGGISVEIDSKPRVRSRLTITGARLDDSGNYTCDAANTEPDSITVYITQVNQIAAVQPRDVETAGASRGQPSKLFLGLTGPLLGLVLLMFLFGAASECTPKEAHSSSRKFNPKTDSESNKKCLSDADCGARRIGHSGKSFGAGSNERTETTANRPSDDEFDPSDEKRQFDPNASPASQNKSSVCKAFDKCGPKKTNASSVRHEIRSCNGGSHCSVSARGGKCPQINGKGRRYESNGGSDGSQACLFSDAHEVTSNRMRGYQSRTTAVLAVTEWHTHDFSSKVDHAGVWEMQRGKASKRNCDGLPDIFHPQEQQNDRHEVYFSGDFFKSYSCDGEVRCQNLVRAE